MSNVQTEVQGLADLDQELADINEEQAERDRRVYRARLLNQALSAVKDAEENLKLLTVQLEKFDLALAAFKKVRKGVEAIPEKTLGGRLSMHSLSARPSVDLLKDVGDYLHEILNITVKMSEERRARTAESIKKTEERLAHAKAAALKLK